jgi:hypothetical protein
MLTVARMLSPLSAALTVVFAVTIGAAHLNLLQLGFEATGVLGGLSFTAARSCPHLLLPWSLTARAVVWD